MPQSCMQHAHCYAFVDAFLIVKQMDVKCLTSIEKDKTEGKGFNEATTWLSTLNPT